MASSPETQADGAASAESLAFGQRLLDVFESIVDLPAIEREAALEALRIESPELERAVRALLARDDRTGPLDRPLAADLGPLLREALPELDPVPAQIGPYKVLRLLGEGGMGRVYLARRGEGPVTREVALKLIRADRAGEGLLARFEAERRHLAALDHPGICRFIDADSLPDGTPYAVMEAVHGEPVIDYCQRHAIGLRGRVELLRQLLAAVAHAHDRLLLHRDIKPHNVLVTAEGQPKLLDFGLAKSIEDAHASVTRTAERFFTPNASAPEQLLGQPAGVACDVYSLGALAYELLAGTLPFDFHGLRAAEIERLILQVAPPLMSERSTQPWARELRGDLDAIVATCLRKSPTERYPNVGALDAELQRWLEGRPVTARAPSWGYRARLFIRRHRTAVGLSAALGLAIVTLGTGVALQAQQSQRTAILLQDMFLSGEGEGLSAYGMNLSKFFARAVERAIADKELAPDRRLGLLHVLATRSTELNDVEASENAARAALATASTSFGERSPSYAEAADRLARILLYNNGTRAVDEAGSLLERSAAAHARHSSEPRAILLHLKARSMLGQFADDHEMMIDSARRTLDIMREDPATSPQHLLNLQSDFSSVLSIAGRQDEATREADEALHATDALLETDTTVETHELWRLVALTACEHRARSRTDSAVELCQRVVDELTLSGNLNSRAGVDGLLWLGTAHAAVGSLDLALKAYNDSLAVLIEIEGESASSVDFHRLGIAIARTSMRKGDYDGLVARLGPALDFFQARYSPTHPIVLAIRLDLLDTLAALDLLTAEHELLSEDFDIDLLPSANQSRWNDLILRYKSKSTPN